MASKLKSRYGLTAQDYRAWKEECPNCKSTSTFHSGCSAGTHQECYECGYKWRFTTRALARCTEDEYNARLAQLKRRTGVVRPESTGQVKGDGVMAKKEKQEGGRKLVGRTTRVGVGATWAWVFAQNEKSSKADKLTDEGISKFMKSEFKGRESAIFDRVQAVRGRYNVGGLTGGAVPQKQSRRYDNQGNPVDVRRGPQADNGAKPKAAKAKVEAPAKGLKVPAGGLKVRVRKA